MKYLHTMVRITDIDESPDFYCHKPGLQEVRRYEHEPGRFTLIFLAAEHDETNCIELTWNRPNPGYRCRIAAIGKRQTAAILPARNRPV